MQLLPRPPTFRKERCFREVRALSSCALRHPFGPTNTHRRQGECDPHAGISLPTLRHAWHPRCAAKECEFTTTARWLLVSYLAQTIFEGMKDQNLENAASRRGISWLSPNTPVPAQMDFPSPDSSATHGARIRSCRSIDK